MKLSYRGASYEREPIPTRLIEGEAVGHYRGQPYKFAYPRHIPVPQAAYNLNYRGVPYRTTAAGGTDAIAPGRPVERVPAFSQAQLHPIFHSSRHAIMGEVARVHQQNIQRRLQHRIDVAKAKGDQNLIHQLEREMQQFA